MRHHQAGAIDGFYRDCLLGHRMRYFVLRLEEDAAPTTAGCIPDDVGRIVALEDAVWRLGDDLLHRLWGCPDKYQVLTARVLGCLAVVDPRGQEVPFSVFPVVDIPALLVLAG